eukprot:scaffold2979_cov243-Pinguiococcus_pyrenoidosus.AAC.10
MLLHSAQDRIHGTSPFLFVFLLGQDHGRGVDRFKGLSLFKQLSQLCLMRLDGHGELRIPLAGVALEQLIDALAGLRCDIGIRDPTQAGQLVPRHFL